MGVRSLEGMSHLVEKALFAKGFSYEGQPVMLTEIGGVAIRTEEDGERENKESWGYTGADDAGTFLEIYERLINAIYQSDLLCGFCYTQLADVEQEQNGLLDECHRYKTEAKEIKRINDQKASTNSFSTVE